MDFKKVLRLIVAGDLSDSAISRICEVHRTTIAKYRSKIRDRPLKLNEIDNLSVDALREVLKLKRQLSSKQWSEPDWDLLARRMSSEKGMVMTVLHAEYERNAKVPMSYIRFRRKLKAHLKSVDQ